MSSAEALYARGFALQQAGRHAEAMQAYRLVAASVVTVNLCCNMAGCLVALGELDEAKAWIDQAAAAKPDDPTVLAVSLQLGDAFLTDGRYAEGWPLMEARIPLNPGLIPPLTAPFPEWKGEPLDGKRLLVWIEQGFGDQLMMVRFVATLTAQGAQVTVACRPALAALFAEAEGVAAVLHVPRGAVVPLGRHDFWTRYFSMPLHLGTTLETLPNAPYLRAPADRRERWRGGGGMGLVWKTSATGMNATAKTLPDAQAQRLLDLGAVSLHPEDTGATDFADTAAIVEQLDLVISVDTAVAHLAGGMGKPCWTLLPTRKLDWRWLRDRPDSPWYPSMRLFRQREADDWTAVVDEVVAALG